MRKILIAVAAAALSIVAVPSIASAQSDPGTIVDVAKANKDLSTLVTAVAAAGLVDTLSGPGPFTVFAPTDEAFKALPAGTLDSLLKDPKGALTDILKLHVIAGEVDAKAATAAAGTNVTTLGGPVAVALKGDKLTVGGATVTMTDIKASNGIIHVIDAVITKPAADAPTAVKTGDDGLAASSSSSSNTGLLLVGGLALVGVASSSMVLARSRRRR